METRKAFERRKKTGWFNYVQGSGIDIGAGPDPLILPEGVEATVHLWDKEDGDATLMEGVPDESFDFVYCAPPSQRVCTQGGWVPIGTIKPGDQVLGRSGFTNVRRVIRIDYKGRDLIRLKCPQGFVEVTANHAISTPLGWLDADKFRKPTKAVCCSTEVQPTQFVNDFDVSARVASLAAFGTFHPRPIAIRQSGFAKLNNQFGLPTLSSEKWLHCGQELNHPRCAVVGYDSRRGLSVLGNSFPGFNIMAKNPDVCHHDLFAAIKYRSVAIYDLDAGLETFARADIHPNTTLPINDSSQVRDRSDIIFLGDVHIVSVVQCLDEVIHLETGDSTFFIEGVLSHNSSHCLEHLVLPHLALGHWYRILKPGGYLLLSIPHRDLYEKKTALPSSWNFDHKTMWLPERDEPPDTLGIGPMIRRVLPSAEIIDISVATDGRIETPPNEHSIGEYSIEVIARKP